MRQKKDSDSFTRNVAYADTGMPGKFEGCVPTEDKNKSQSNAEHNGDKKRTNLPSRFGIKDTIYEHPKTDKPIVQDQREMNGMLDGTENKIETLNQTTKASSLGPTIINDNYNSQQNIKNNTNSIYTRVQNPILPNPYPRNNEFQGIQPKPLDQSSWSHQSYRPDHYTTNYPTSQLWTDQNQPRQQQLWHD
ncbi:hypothetical protein AM593_10210, partial [Mytilus galloprovincialis]